MFGAWAILVVCCNFDTTFVILEGATYNAWCWCVEFEVSGFDLVHQIDHVDNLA